MHKKLMMACMAIAAFAAFVIAPAASASPVLTSEGKSVPVGTSITATNTGETLFTGTFNVRCDHVHMAGTVTANTGTQIKGTIPVGGASFNGTGTNTDCTSFFGSTKVTVTSELCLEANKGSDSFITTGCEGKPVLFDLQVTGLGVCEYEAASVSGNFTTAPEEAVVTVSEQEAKLKSGSGFTCPSSGKLDMTYDVYTTGGVRVTIS